MTRNALLRWGVLALATVVAIGIVAIYGHDLAVWARTFLRELARAL